MAIISLISYLLQQTTWMGMKKQLLKRWGDRTRLTGRNLSNSESSTSLPRWQLSHQTYTFQPRTGRTGHHGLVRNQENYLLQLINILFLHLIHHKMNSVIKTALFLSSGHFNCVSGQHASVMTSLEVINSCDDVTVVHGVVFHSNQSSTRISIEWFVVFSPPHKALLARLQSLRRR